MRDPNYLCPQSKLMLAELEDPNYYKRIREHPMVKEAWESAMRAAEERKRSSQEQNGKATM